MIVFLGRQIMISFPPAKFLFCCSSCQERPCPSSSFFLFFQKFCGVRPCGCSHRAVLPEQVLVRGIYQLLVFRVSSWYLRYSRLTRTPSNSRKWEPNTLPIFSTVWTPGSWIIIPRNVDSLLELMMWYYYVETREQTRTARGLSSIWHSLKL